MKSRIGIAGLVAAGTATVFLAGCCTCLNQTGPGRCADVPRGALPDPVGAHVHRFQDAQRKNAGGEQFVIFANEWYMGGKALGPYGEYHVQQIAKQLPGTPCSVYIQPTLDAALNEERRRVVMTRLLADGVGDAELRVKVEYAATEGLPGAEAARVYTQMLQSGNAATTGLPTGNVP